MVRHSAGIILYRSWDDRLEFLLVHPGGPFWANKDEHAWSVPKGEFDETEPAEAAARREFQEETGQAYDGALKPLSPVKTPGGKIIHAFLGEGSIDIASLKSNFFEMEWPPKSGRMQSFPEVDKAAWFTLVQARDKINKGQIPILDLVERILR